jgi:hypothetical protein
MAAGTRPLCPPQPTSDSPSDSAYRMASEAASGTTSQSSIDGIRLGFRAGIQARIPAGRWRRSSWDSYLAILFAACPI